MSIEGVCPTCLTVASLELFLCHGKYKQCNVVFARLPRDVAYTAVRYLSLFRPASGRAMSPDKALRLLEEIEKLVGSGYVQIERRPARKCSPAIWAEAMDRMRDNPKLRCPMPNHNYLRDVAYDLADKADADREKKTVEAERGGNMVTRPGGDPQPVSFEGISPEILARLPENVKKKYGL